MYFDLNIPYEKQANVDIVSQLIKFGYDGLAWNITINAKSTLLPATSTIKLAKVPDNVNSPNKVLRLGTSPSFRQYTRLTVNLLDMAQLHVLNPTSPVVRSYDIFAVKPGNEKLFHHACTEMSVDIITFDFTERVEYKFKRSSIDPAITRGIFFEINYSQGIRDSTAKRYLISNALELVKKTKGRNIIISSDALKAMDIRSPHDLANLGTVFGMNFDQALKAVSSNCNSVVMHGGKVHPEVVIYVIESRKTEKSVLISAPVESIRGKEAWKIPNVQSLEEVDITATAKGLTGELQTMKVNESKEEEVMEVEEKGKDVQKRKR